MNKDIQCPFCGEKDIEIKNAPFNTEFHCPACDRHFDLEDIDREGIRHKIARILIDTDENNQLWIHNKLYCRITNTDGCLDNGYLNELNTKRPFVTDRCYQIPGDGTIWFRIADGKAPDGDELWLDFDDIGTSDLRNILKSIENRQGNKPLEIPIEGGYDPSDLAKYEGYGTKWIPVPVEETDSGQVITDEAVGELWREMNSVANTIAEECGQNVDYCVSVDFSVFPYLIAPMAPDECEGFLNERDNMDQQETYEFLAENNAYIPYDMLGSTAEQYKQYILGNKESLYETIKKTIQSYYEEYVTK